VDEDVAADVKGSILRAVRGPFCLTTEAEETTGTEDDREGDDEDEEDEEEEEEVEMGDVTGLRDCLSWGGRAKWGRGGRRRTKRVKGSLKRSDRKSKLET